MKKRLFSILTILGIGCSFCSADGVYHNSDLGLISVVINGETKYTLKDKNEGATCTILNDSCSYGTYFSQGTFSCSDGFYLPELSYLQNTFYPDFFNLIGATNNQTKSNGLYNYLLFPIAGRFEGGQYYEQNLYGYYYIGYSDKSLIYYTVYGGYFSLNVTFNANTSLPIRCFKSSVVEPEKSSWSVITGDELPDLTPKFKVNYGNTSYEYELDSDLSIYLKSPVIQSGNTFTYAGNTGINLFYNGTFQRYNKSNLYLDSMFWYNKNIFTPICL